jgi:alginate O-acetyltransferase complex protein AlgJ
MPITSAIRNAGNFGVLAVFASFSCLHFVCGPEEEPNAMRALAPSPGTPTDLVSVVQYPAAYEQWFVDHFGGRGRLLALNTRFTMGAFGVSPSDQVVLGNDGWLYFTSSGIFADRRGEELLSNAQLELWRGVFEGRSKWLSARGVAYSVVVAPNKVTIYPEHLPWHHRTGQGAKTRLTQLVEHLRDHSTFRIIDGREPLRAEARSSRTYHATDSHWNDVGGFLCYQAIASEWTSRGVIDGPLALSGFERVQKPYTGDLTRLLPGLPWAPEAGWFMVSIEPSTAKTVPPPDNWQSLPAELVGWTAPVLYENVQGRGVLLAFGDSFQFQMMPFLASHFRRSFFISTSPADFAILEALTTLIQPTVVLEQRVERNMKWIPKPHPADLPR